MEAEGSPARYQEFHLPSGCTMYIDRGLFICPKIILTSPPPLTYFSPFYDNLQKLNSYSIILYNSSIFSSGLKVKKYD
jgi:hypothetical protein